MINLIHGDCMEGMAKMPDKAAPCGTALLMATGKLLLSLLSSIL